MSHAAARRTPQSEPEPAWEIAYLFPAQGHWSEEEYLGLNGNHLVEFSNGYLEVLPIPTTWHQMLVAYLYGVLLDHVGRRPLGTVLFAALRVRLWRGKFREPDILFMAKAHVQRIKEEYWDGADLVMEVVSGNKEDRRRDLVIKRGEYARAGIPEYWIVDPEKEQIIVLRLAGKKYAVHGKFGKGSVATSCLLPGFTVDVTTAFSQHVPGPASPGKAKRRNRS
jgi:Uma2 family endonuclease